MAIANATAVVAMTTSAASSAAAIRHRHPSAVVVGVVLAFAVIKLLLIVYLFKVLFCGPGPEQEEAQRLGSRWDPAALERRAPLRRAGELELELEGELCAVCLEALAPDTAVELRQLPCGHLFHGACLDPWLRLHLRCPTCRLSPLGKRSSRSRSRTRGRRGRQPSPAVEGLLSTA
mmetsp:Transcript_29047/g.92635  ORF Transcript_29047/g.92635 Transcript_29047/m.92635 type:complete len:176 (-) Transcript_29047:391-918(-)